MKSAQKDPNKTVLTVDLKNVIQDDFLGVNAVYHGFAFMPEQTERGMDDASRAREFDRVKRAELKIARTWYRPDWACGAALSGEYNWDSVKMQAFYKWLEAMKEINVDIALQAGWWFTGDTYYGKAAPNTSEDPELYAAWVSESLNQLINVKGFTNIKYLVLFTEPTSYESGTVPEGYTQWSYYAKVVRAINDRLVKDGRRNLVKFVGPNNSGDGKNLLQATKELNDVLDIYSGHSYNYPNYTKWSKLCERMENTVSSTGKELWLDEFGKQNEEFRQTADYGNYLAQTIAASINAGNQTSLIWILFDQQYVGTSTKVGNTTTNDDSFHNGVHRWGTCKWPFDDIENPTYPYPHWYAFSLMSKYLGSREKTEVFKTTNDDNVYLVAMKSGEDYSFMVVNGNKEAREFTVRASSAIKKTLYRYQYDPKAIVPTEDAKLIDSSLTLENVSKGFTDTVPAGGFAIYSSIK